MALVLKDRVKETSTTVGAGPFTLDGAVAEFQSFSVIGTGNTTYYAIVDQSGTNWEVGIGTWTSPNQLARNTVLASSNSGSIVTFAPGTKDVFVTYPTEKAIYQDASGNVGIGTSSPNAKLDVNGHVKVGDLYSYCWGDYSTSINGSSADDFISFYTTSAERMRIDSSGNVGIGTSSPGEKLDVNGNIVTSNNYGLTIRDSSGTGRRLALISPSNQVYYGDIDNALTGSDLLLCTNNALRFYTNASEKMRIDQSGKVGIGTSSPTTQLDVAGSAVKFYNPALTTTGDATTSVYFDKPTVGWSNAKFLANNFTFNLRNSTDAVVIDSSGNVGIGITNPANLLDIGNHYTGNPLSAKGIRIASEALGAGSDQYSTRYYFGIDSGGIPYGQLMGPKDASGWLAFTTGASDTERMRIASNGNITYTGTIVPRVTESATYTSWNSSTTDLVSITAQTTAITIGADAGGATAVNGQKITFRIVASGASCTVTFDSGASYKFKGIGITLPSSRAVANGETLMVGAIYNTNSLRWEVVALTQG